MKTPKKQKMMIVWKWKDLQHINKKSWEKTDFIRKDYINNIEKGNGVFYREYDVEKSDLCPNAQLIAASIYQVPREQSFKNEALLDAILDRYLTGSKKKKNNEAKEQQEFMLFLHRGNQYTEKDIDRIWEKYGSRISSIFLFANNRDFIYYGVRRKGLLNDNGSFFKGSDPYTDEEITICETNTEKKPIIKQPYFDRIWLHYRIEFETKVFKLKEDLFECWMPFLLPNQPENIEIHQLMGSIKANNEAVLYYRLKSFLNLYSTDTEEQLKAQGDFNDIDHFEDEKYILIEYEQKDRASYLFDDYIINMEHLKKDGQEFISEDYEKIKNNMLDLLMGKKEWITKNELRNIMDDLNHLTKIIPGLMD